MDLQAARSRHAFLSTFDDHEVHNNWVQNISQDPDVSPGIFALRKQGAMQAWYEHMPVRKAMIPNGPLILANRQIAYGDLAAINLLDTRSFRSDQACGDKWSIDPCPEVFDADRQVLGEAQEKWLDANLGRRDATWNCLAQQIMMMPLNRQTGDGDPKNFYNLDSWAGYDAARKRLMARLAKVGNTVVLTGDEHQNYAGLLYDEDRPVAAESVITSLTSGGDGRDLRNGSDRLLERNPQLKFVNDQRGYGVCEVTPDAWQTQYKVLDKVSVPGGTLSLRATATVPRDRVEIALS
jgi:alkaline phosphatase D